jgi:nucleotide-binding universal stress UspA family protein
MDASANAPQWPLKAILYATDFSACTENAGNYASLLARKLDVDLLVAHAFILTQFAMEVEAESRQPAKSAQRKDLEATIAATAGRVGQGVKRAVPVLLEGDPREAIPRAAAEHAPSLIVLGTRGRGRVERGIVGSVAERILRATSGPSLTVGPLVPVCEPGSVPFRRVLYATGLSPEAARGATYAVAMAQAFDASLDVLHVARSEDMEHPDRFSEIQKQFYEVVDGLVPRHADAIRNPHGFVEAGSANTRILEHVREFHTDLLVLSIRKSSHLWLQSRLSGAFHIIANAPCPVMTITG